MFNRLVKTLNGHGDDVASLEAAVVQLGHDRDETRDKIAALQKQRHAALLDDASDTEIDKLERQLDRALVRLEKISAAEPLLLAKLTGARSEARQRRWQALHDAYLKAAAKFLISARATAETHAALIATVFRAQQEGFAGEVSAMLPPTPNVNGNALAAPDLLDEFERAIAAAAPARTAIAGPAKTPIAAPPAQLPSTRAQTSLAAKRQPDDLSALSPGECRVVVLVTGWCPQPDAPPCHAGQKIKMDAIPARAAAQRGSVEIVEANIDRTEVLGGDFEKIDPGTPLTALGAGGLTLIRVDDTKA